MHALRLPALAAIPPPTLLAVPVGDPKTPTVGDLWGRVEGIVTGALAASTADEFFEISRTRIGPFNHFMGTLAELLVDEQDILTPEALAAQAMAVDENLSKAISTSTRTVRRALAIRERLFSARPLEAIRDEGGPLHLFASFGTWHGWTLVCVAVMLRSNVRVTDEVHKLLVRLMLETSRDAFVVLRTAEIDRAHAEVPRAPQPASIEGDKDLADLEREAQLRSTEAFKDTRERVRQLVEEGRVGEARKLAASGAEVLRDWAELLRPPRVTTGPATGQGDFDENVRWLRANMDRFRGSWVALANGALLGSNASRLALHRKLEAEEKLTSALFVKVDGLCLPSAVG